MGDAAGACFASANGASFAAPEVAAVAAMIADKWANNLPHAPTPAEIRAKIISTGQGLDDTLNPVRSPYLRGLNAAKALQTWP